MTVPAFERSQQVGEEYSEVKNQKSEFNIHRFSPKFEMKSNGQSTYDIVKGMSFCS